MIANGPGRRFGWVPLVLGAWLLIFGGYEVAERTLLRGASPDLLHLLHIVRGTGTSFILAGLVAWYLIRRSPEEVDPSAVHAGLRTIVAESDARYLGLQAAWIIRLRWIAIAGVLLTALACQYVFEAIDAFSAVALILIAAAMAVSNGFFSALPVAELARLRTAFAQVFLDLIALTMMLYFAGGLQNPFFTFYIFHVVIAGILLSRRQTYVVTLVTCLLFCGMSLLQESGAIRTYPIRIGEGGAELRLVSGWLAVSGVLAAFVGTACCTAYFTTTIMENLRTRSAQLIDAVDTLSQERAKTEDVARRVGAGLVILDLDDRIVWANEIARAWFGSDLPGGLCFRRLWSHDERCRDCPTALASTGGPSTSEVSAVVDGTRRFFLLSCSPVRGADGRPQQIMGLIQDITSMKEMQFQLLQAGKMAAVGQLAAGIAHEISNPLATVASSAEILREAAAGGNGDTAALLDRHLRKIEENVYRCKGIIQNLLGFARRRNEAGEEVDVPALLDDTLRLVEGNAKARERSIVRRYPSGPALRLTRSHPLDLQQVVLNLLLNALDATAPGGTVTLTAARVEGGVEIAVSDTGPGIASEHLGRLFEPFFTTKPVGKGTGLGLYLSHRLVEGMRGRIAAESPPGKGATFRVWLPIEGTPPVSASGSEERTSTGAGKSAGRST
ncbi:MAG: PAS domain-containing protein [Planctomycetes bacterium]|nr:PAS domain-containing protein [Planctomycetota bacterium]